MKADQCQFQAPWKNLLDNLYLKTDLHYRISIRNLSALVKNLLDYLLTRSKQQQRMMKITIFQDN